jgi:hypothetical protein
MRYFLIVSVSKTGFWLRTHPTAGFLADLAMRPYLICVDGKRITPVNVLATEPGVWNALLDEPRKAEEEWANGIKGCSPKPRGRIGQRKLRETLSVHDDKVNARFFELTAKMSVLRCKPSRNSMTGAGARPLGR